MSRPQNPSPPPAPSLQHWRQQGEHDASGRGYSAGQPNWQQQPPAPGPQSFQQPAYPAQQQPHPQQQHYPPPQQPPAYPSAPPQQQQYAQQPAYAPQPPMPHAAPQQGYDPRYAPPPRQAPAQPPPQPMQQPMARDLGGLDAYGVQLGAPAQQPRTAPPQRAAPPPQPGFADYGDRGRQQAYAPQPGQPQPQPQLPPQHQGFRNDVSGYDLGSYGVPPPAPAARQAQPGFGPPPLGHPQQQPQGQPQGQPVNPGFAAPFGAPASQDYGYAPAGEALPAEQDEEYDELEFDEEPRRGRRWLIAAALVGSIGVGGGMAYAYKTFMAPRAVQSNIVKASREPSKIAPDNPGGKRFPNADSKLMNRLEADVAGNSQDLDSNGVRRVQTVTVGPDRGVVANSMQPQPGMPSAVPGMTIVGADPMPQPSASPFPPAQPTRTAAPQASAAGGLPRIAPAPPPPPPAKPQVVARTTQPAAYNAIAAVAPDSTKPARQPVPKSAKPAAHGNGYVAVLGYQRNQLDAMKALADLQQKYDMLKNKKLEIVESDQSARGLGTIYRIVVGPSGSLGAAKDLCSQLVAQGHPAKDCYTLQN